MTSKGIDRRTLVALGGAAALSWTTNAGAQGAVRFGVIEIGASGVKSSALTFTRAQLREPRGEHERGQAAAASDRFDANVVGSFNDNPNVRDPGQIAATVDSVARAQTRLHDEFNVTTANIVVVGSSSVDALAHRNRLLDALRQRNIDVDFVTPAQEAEYLFRWIVLPNRRDQAMTIDIGSGNTKGGYLLNPGPHEAFQAFNIADGSRSLAQRTDAASHNAEGQVWNNVLVAQATQFIDGPARTQLNNSPALDQMPRCYLVGGAAWAMTSVMHPGESVDDNTHWVTLNFRDISAFREVAYAGVALDPDQNPGLAARLARLRSQSPDAEQRARALLRQVGGAISPSQMKAGAEILSILSRRFNFEHKQALSFSKEGLYAWSTMYLLTKLNMIPRAH